MKEVAAILVLKAGTIAFHKYRMMQTLSLKTNAELRVRHQAADEDLFPISSFLVNTPNKIDAPRLTR